MDTEKNLTESILGKWTESKDSTTSWIFQEEDVKWRSYHHFYTLNGDSLMISNLLYKINLVKDDTLYLTDPASNEIILVRAKSDSSKLFI